jgi:hypothetical protein
LEPQEREVEQLTTEIRLAEQKCAEKLAQAPLLTHWVKEFRKKYITDGFLMPLYAGDGAYSRPRERIQKYGDFILPYEKVGEVFHGETYKDRIHQESMWFWEYLVSGQQVIFAKEQSELPEHIRLDSIPAHAVWQELVQIATQMGCFGENGGGILLSPPDLDADQLDHMRKQDIWQDAGDGYLEEHPGLSRPLWIDRFQNYEQIEDSEMDIEIRPAWFHIANHAFFDAAIQRLPVFVGTFDTQGKVSGIKFLDENLPDSVRQLITEMMMKIPVEIRNRFDSTTQKREQRDMMWWLWKNVGYHKRKGTISYGEIAQLTKVSRSTVSTAVKRFDNKLHNKLDNKLLERLLLTAGHLRLGHNLTYNVLASRSLVPHRAREIDSFDQLDRLI